MQDTNGDRSIGHAIESSRHLEGAVTDRRVRAYIGLGANVGDPNTTLASAVRSVAALPGVRLRGVSQLYATKPVGVTEQPEFRNAVVALDLPAGPDPSTGALTLLGQLKDLERASGRRTRGRWGPRELDLDLLVFGRARLGVERPPEARSIDTNADPLAAAKLLVVPHPSAAERLFVLAPLADLASGLVPPGWGRSVETARRRHLETEAPDAVRAVGIWDADAQAWLPVQPR
jgi:2-amino-4-hydroxy-6-hydroxymethyldihydropteridine diphosphokinase